jgi:hypothetical protein
MKTVGIWARVEGRYQRGAARWLGKRPTQVRTRVPVISFSFDDFPRSALLAGGSILQKYGVAGTYYASLGLMNQDSPSGRIFSPQDLKTVIANGHELGCHTFSHCHAWETAPDDFEQSIADNQRALAGLLPGATFQTLSYPLGCPRPETKRRAGKHFACCRGGGQTFNAGQADLNCLNAFFLEQSRNDFSLVKSMIDDNDRAAGWLIFATHDVDDQPSPFGCDRSFFENCVRCAVKSGARILPVARAWDALHSN